jgi:glutamate/tyrosine decarboxylase-like PLP-dependent enzyme
VRSFSGQPVFYASRESHLAWVKIAQQAGIGRAALRMVATDGTGRMDMHALADAVGRDREQGLVPVMIAATAGTTSAGMIDPIGACVDIAREHGMWCHVDAAWAGGAIASDRLRGVLAGIEHADSVTIDAHKWLAATMGCGIFLTRHAALLSTTFNCAASYMPSSVVDLDPYMLTVQWSRRFLGLRLFLTLAAAGWEGYAAHVERSVAMSELLRETMLERGWSVVNASPVAVLSLEPPPGSAPIPAIVSQIVSSGGAWISVAKLEGRDVIRACMTHGETMPEDVLRLADLLATAASTAKG